MDEDVGRAVEKLQAEWLAKGNEIKLAPKPRRSNQWPARAPQPVGFGPPVINMNRARKNYRGR